MAFLLPDMRGGGAERVALELIKHFVSRGHSVDLVLFRARGELLLLLPPQVRVTDLNVRHFRNAILPLARYLRKTRPDALQASMWPVTLVAILARGISRVRCRLVVSEHSNVSVQFSEQPTRLRLIGLSLRLFYPRADVRVCVSHDVAVDLAKISGLKFADFEIVYNPIEQRKATTTAAVQRVWTGKKGRVLSVGTLKRQKNHPLLLRAFSILLKRRPANLIILGEGDLRPTLEQMIVDLSIGDAVSMPGFVLDPTPYYASADVFALSSDYEGFANVLVEAMAAGLAVVSTDCRSGPSEVLDGGTFGRLVPVGDAEAMAAALEEALCEQPDRNSLRARAREFRPEIAGDRYLELMLSVSLDRAN